jgi:hypothetical protein
MGKIFPLMCNTAFGWMSLRVESQQRWDYKFTSKKAKLATTNVYGWVMIISDMQNSRAHGVKIKKPIYRNDNQEKRQELFDTDKPLIA